jgi:hypothetical protein
VGDVGAGKRYKPFPFLTFTSTALWQMGFVFSRAVKYSVSMEREVGRWALKYSVWEKHNVGASHSSVNGRGCQ